MSVEAVLTTLSRNVEMFSTKQNPRPRQTSYFGSAPIIKAYIYTSLVLLFLLLRIFPFTQALRNGWKFIPHHVCNEHEWTDGDGKRHWCDNAPLTAHEEKKRLWIQTDSVAFQDLWSLVLDKRLLKDLEKMALFKHTGENRLLSHIFHYPIKHVLISPIHFPFLFLIAHRATGDLSKCSTETPPQTPGLLIRWSEGELPRYARAQ